MPLLDLFPSVQQDQAAPGGWAPMQSLGTSPSDAFASAWEANTRYGNTMSWINNMADAAQDHLDAYKAKTGEELPNPYRQMFSPLTFDGTAFDAARQDVRSRSVAGAQRFNDPSLALPDDDTLYREGIAKAQAAQARLAQSTQGTQAFGTGLARGAAGLASQFADPIDAGLNALAIATVPEEGAVRAILGAAATFGGQAAATDALSFQYKKAVNPDYGLGDVATDVVANALGGAALEGGGRALAGVWRTLRGRAPAIADAVPQAAQDAGNAAERVADLDANNPFKTGFSGQAAHNEALATVERDLVNNREPQIPASAAQEGAAPLGQVFVGSRGIPVKYELAEAGDLITSHDRFFRENPAYPPELQPRDRSSAPAQEQVYNMAANLQPERLGPSVEANSGAPVVGPDNIVESGNGRTLALNIAYERGADGPYRAFLERSGYDTAGLQQPVLIARRVLQFSDDERAAFAHAANGSASLRMSATEQAVSDARHIGPDISHLLQPGDVGAAANRDFVRALAAKMPAGERGGMLTRAGGLSQNGVRRVQAALTARAYGDPAFVARAFDHPDPNIKTIASAMVDAAPDWIKMRDAVTAGQIKSGQDITEDMMRSISAIMRARDEGRPVGEILNQSDMFQSDVSALAARLFFKDNELKRFLSKKAMADNLQTFARDLRARGPDRDLFGEEPPSAAQTLEGTIKRSDAMVNSMIADSVTPKAVEAAFHDPKVIEAAEADLSRMIEQGKNRVPIEGPDGSVELGFADKELHDLDQQLALAKEVEGCAAPVQEAAE